MKTQLLKAFHAFFKENSGTITNYAIPDLWAKFDLSGLDVTYTHNGEILIDPHAFFATLIERVFLPHAPDTVASLSQRHKREHGGAWLKDALIYSALIRTSSAWDHDRSGALEDKNRDQLKETGTFIKTLALLPFLKEMGINTLYLLPIMTFSKAHKKGDLGSPYGVQDFFLLDEALKEDLTGDAFTLDEEFRVLIEACHSLDIRVMIDIIPKTNAIDSYFIKDHPEWFYWIKKDEKPNYKPPYIKGVDKTAIPTKKHIPAIYRSAETKKHIARFSHNPKKLDPKTFNKLKNRKNILKAIEETMNLTIAPAFSDHVNDPQPPWTDVTFFRLFFDHPEHAKDYLEKDTPPYILFDTIKSNLYPGKDPNTRLWNMIADIIPYYQRTFGIDGARIDMGHALPNELLNMIITKARDYDADFAFIAEELNNANAAAAKKNGYNIIVGNGFIDQPRIFTGNAKRFFYQAADIPLPLFAGAETHDTPRLAAREGNETLAKTLTVLNLFMPNGVPFINSGVEIFETQAMNLGLDASEMEMKRLDLSDPYYNKLALFDKYQLHYTYQKRYVLPAILKRLHPLRKKYLGAIKNKRRFFPLKTDNPLFIGLGYVYRKKLFFVLGNLNPYGEEWIKPDIKVMRTFAQNQNMQGTLLFSTNEETRPFTQFSDTNTLDIHLAAGEVKIVEIP